MAGRPSAFRSDAARAEYFARYDEAVALSPVPVVESDVTTAFGATHVLTAGDPAKPPLLALHAKSCSATMWMPLLPALVETHHVRMVDAVGDLGKSVATDVLSSPAKVVGWLDEVLAGLDIERTAIVAASIGTWMAVHYAKARPERIERLALLCPAGIVCGQHPMWTAKMLLKMVPRPRAAAVQALFDSMAMPATRARLQEDPWRPVTAQFVAGLVGFKPNMREPRPNRFDLEGLNPTYPVLAMVGRDETLHDGAKYADLLRSKLPDAQVELVDDANHLVFVDQQSAVEDRLRAFLAS